VENFRVMKKAEAWKLLLDGKPICHSAWKYNLEKPFHYLRLEGLFIYEYMFSYKLQKELKEKTGYNYYHEADGWEEYPTYTQEEIDSAKLKAKEWVTRVGNG
jgi:hypothetical protein